MQRSHQKKEVGGLQKNGPVNLDHSNTSKPESNSKMIWVKPWFSDHADFDLAEDKPLESSKGVNNPDGDRKYNNRPPTLVNPFFDKHQFLWLFIDVFTLSHRMT
jgi:hypothetical protein